MKRISPGQTPQKEPKKLPTWAELGLGSKGYDVGLRFLQNAIVNEDEEGINMMHSVLSQLGAKSVTLGGDYKQMLIHTDQQHQVRRLGQMLKFAYPGNLEISNPLLHKIWMPLALYELHHMKPSEYGYSSDFGYRETLRDFATKEYSWAIPTNEAVAAILSYNKNIVEVGSGMGYWAACLESAGGQVTAIDNGSANYKPKFFPATIVQDGANYLREHDGARNATMFVCWGGDMNGALAAFKGEYLAVVGEEPGGCTWWPFSGDGSGEFDRDHEEEEQLTQANQQQQEWKCIKEVIIPCWPHIHDLLAIFQRVPVSKP